MSSPLSELVDRSQKVFAHAWMVRTFIKHSDEAEDFPEILNIARVVFVLDPKQKNPLVVLDQLQLQRIVPKHVIEPLLAKGNNDINEFNKLKFNDHPVGSGPYPLHSYSSEKIVMNFWSNRT